VAVRLVDNVLGLIGATPLVRLKSQESPGSARLYGKF